jgi:SAM-dependent methyltransferase
VIRETLRRRLPASVVLRASRARRRLSRRRVRMGHLGRLEPVSREFGYERGLPIDRHYIEAFLGRHAADVQGRVLEIGDRWYTRGFGGDQVTRSDVLHAVPGNPEATIVGDLADGTGLEPDAYDCVILTQTLLVIWDVEAAIRTVHRVLRPGGVVLATVPGGCHRVISEDLHQWGDYWRFTSLAVRRLFGDVFGEEHVRVEAHGNVVSAIAFLAGLSTTDLRARQLAHRDPDYEVTIAVRAVKGPPPAP